MSEELRDIQMNKWDMHIGKTSDNGSY